VNWSKFVRQSHRWLSIAFTLTVIVNSIAVAQKMYTNQLGPLAVIPLALLLVTGRSLFSPLYSAKWRGGR